MVDPSKLCPKVSMQATSVGINRGNIRQWIVGAVAILLLGMVVAGYDLWSAAFFYASTDNARITGDLVHVGALATGRVTDVDVKVGDPVARGQSVATIQMTFTSTSPGGAATFTNVHLRAPMGGTVVSVPVTRGQMVTVGEPVVIIVDPEVLWVVANMDETALTSIRTGQKAEVHVNLLDRDLEGEVTEMLPEYLPGASASSASSTSTIVPVRIDIVGERADLHPGMSAYVKIRIR